MKDFFLGLNGFDNRRLLWINRLIVFLALIFSFNEVYAKNILVVLLLLWISVVKLSDIKLLFKNPVIIFFVSFLMMIIMSFFYTEIEPSYTIKYFDRFIIYMFLPMIIIATTVERKYIKYAISAFILAMFVNEIISYGILFGWWLELKHGYPVYFMPHVFYSILLAFAIMILVYKLRNEKNIFLKLIAMLFIVTMLGNLVISGGRSGQVTLLVVFTMTMLIVNKISIKNIIIIVLMPTITILLAYFIYNPFKDRINHAIFDVENVIKSDNYNTSFGNRLAGFVLTNKMMQDNTILEILIGHGVGDLDKVKREAVVKYYPTQMDEQISYKHFHNSYLDVIGWIGVIGFMLLVLFLVAIYRIKIKDSEINFIKIALFFVLFMSYFPDSSLDSQYIMLLTSIFVGLLLAQSKFEVGELNNEK